jgi:hypothetical protein
MTPDRYRPGHPCPAPDCDGRLEADDEWPVICSRCHWIPGADGITRHAAIAWLRRCATGSIPPRTAAERRAEDVARMRERWAAEAVWAAA